MLLKTNVDLLSEKQSEYFQQVIKQVINLNISLQVLNLK